MVRLWNPGGQSVGIERDEVFLNPAFASGDSLAWDRVLYEPFIPTPSLPWVVVSQRGGEARELVPPGPSPTTTWCVPSEVGPQTTTSKWKKKKNLHRGLRLHRVRKSGAVAVA
jgi:hypothetical protein